MASISTQKLASTRSGSNFDWMILKNVNQSKKWAVDAPWKTCIRLHFSFRISREKGLLSKRKIEPDRRLCWSKLFGGGEGRGWGWEGEDVRGPLQVRY